jgi:hypothetical protein
MLCVFNTPFLRSDGGGGGLRLYTLFQKCFMQNQPVCQVNKTPHFIVNILKIKMLNMQKVFQQ